MAFFLDDCGMGKAYARQPKISIPHRGMDIREG
jgi:hypothetical protein